MRFPFSTEVQPKHTLRRCWTMRVNRADLCSLTASCSGWICVIPHTHTHSPTETALLPLDCLLEKTYTCSLRLWYHRVHQRSNGLNSWACWGLSGWLHCFKSWLRNLRASLSDADGSEGEPLLTSDKPVRQSVNHLMWCNGLQPSW